MTGIGDLVRLILRRDRALLVVWIAFMALFPLLIAIATIKAYPTADDMTRFAAESLGNPTELAARGPVFAATVGGLTAWACASSGVLVGGVVSMLVVVRHTRADEQAGRRELLAAGALGRHAPLAAALAVVAGANLVIAALAAAGLVGVGLPAAGAVALGLVLGLGSLVFGAVGAVTAQLVEGAGAARGIALVVLGIAFLLAAVGDLGVAGMVWVSPLGWARHLQAFAGERWWVLALPLLAAAVLAAGAFALSARRDVGGGLVRPRPGPAKAGPALRGPFTLAWRLQRPSIGAWTGGMAALGVLLGAAMGSLGDQLDTPAFQAFAATAGGGSVADVFFRFVLYVLAQVVAAATVVEALRARTQETSGLADVLLVQPVGRVRWALGNLAVTALGAALILAGLGIGAGVGHGSLWAELGVTLAYLPACLVFAAIATALVGWAPRAAAPVTWVLLVAAVLADVLGEFRLVDTAALQVSPFILTVTPLTAGSGLLPALATLTVSALVVAAAGLAGLRRRDIAT